MPALKQDEKGNYFLDTGGGVLQPLSVEQAQAVFDNPDAGAGVGAALSQGIDNLVTGGGSLLSDNPYWREANKQGQQASEALTLQHGLPAAGARYAPQVGAGVATAGAGLIPTVGLEAGLGALTTPETPVQGAVLGGLGGAAGFALPAVGAWAGQQGRQLAGKLPWFRQANPMDEIPINPGGMMPGERPPLAGSGAPDVGPGNQASAGATTPEPLAPSANPPGAAPNPAPRMAERVTDTLAQADARTQVAGTRVMEGTMTPDELYTRGVPTSPGDRALLSARAGDDAAGAAARELLQQESASTSHPVFGQGLRNIRDAQQQSATNFLARELDVPHGINLTDPMLSDVVANIGGRMDQIATDMGTVPLSQEIKNEFAEILTQTTGSHKAQLQTLIDEIGAMSDLNGGVLTGDQWGQMRTKLNKMVDSGMGQGNLGKIHDAGQVLETMTNAMESGLPDVTREELARLRKQYAIAMTLTKPGTRNADGQVNPVSFYNNWKRPQSKKTRGTDDVGRFMNTMVTLTQKRTPDSGTAGRLLQAGAGIAADLVPGGNMVRRVTGI